MSNTHFSQAEARKIPASRLSRGLRMGGMVAGIAGNMARDGLKQLATGERPTQRDLLLTPANMRRVTDQLAKMRGAAMKMGQLMSMDTGDVLPRELSDILSRLRADADFMPPKDLRRVLIDNWGADWQQRFSRFDVRPIAAASIGQVHKAKLKDGRTVAIKVQYPGIRRSIDSDVANLGRLVKLSGLLPDGFALDPYLDEARRQLHEESDYTREATCLTAFADLMRNDPDFALPQTVPDLCTPDILAMTYLPGDPVESLDTAPKAQRDQIATRLISLTLRELFHFGQMQTDPNFANYHFDPKTGKIILLDFGALRHLPPDLVPSCAQLVHAGLAQDRTALSGILDTMGLVPHNVAPHHRATILDMVQRVFAEILRSPDLDLSQNDLARYLSQTGEALARDGFIPPPVPLDLLYIQRKVAGMFLLASRLNATIPAQDLLRQYVPQDQPSQDIPSSITPR